MGGVSSGLRDGQAWSRLARSQAGKAADGPIGERAVEFHLRSPAAVTGQT